MKYKEFSLALLIAIFFLAGCAAGGSSHAMNQESVAIEKNQKNAAVPQAESSTSSEDSVAASTITEVLQPDKTIEETQIAEASLEPKASVEQMNLTMDSVTDGVLQDTATIEPKSTEITTSLESLSDSLVDFVDPYIAIPALVETIFANADSLYKQGLTDSAIAYVERFRVIKPLWTSWEVKADSLRNKFGASRAMQSKKYEPFVLEIQNMNRVQSAYSLVANVADSLIVLAPGDSLIAWANLQKKIAFDNTFAKAKREKDEIWNLANVQGQFEKAVEQAKNFQMRYRDFEDSLHIEELIGKIQELIDFRDLEASAYWSKNDPNVTMSSVDSLMKKEFFIEAKKLLNLLKYSSLRAQAMEKYKALADAYCNKERKATSQFFAKAQKQKDIEKKRKLLNDAMVHLDRCLMEFPEYSQRGKVLDNKNFLQKELAK